MNTKAIIACTCPECRAMCQRRPCWPTPQDAQRLIDAGHGDRLMRDWWYDHTQEKTIFLLTPAIASREGANAPAIPKGACTFLDKDSLCTLHDRGLKPTEGRLALCGNRTPEGLHEQVGRTWDGEEGRALVRQWEAQHVTPDHWRSPSGRPSPHARKRPKHNAIPNRQR